MRERRTPLSCFYAKLQRFSFAISGLYKGVFVGLNRQPEGAASNEAWPRRSSRCLRETRFAMIDPKSFAARFPGDFTFGVATAAFQIEGATKADGRKPS